MAQSRAMGLAIQDAHQATLSVELLLLWLQWGDFGWHQDSGLQFAIWCGGWEKGGHRYLSLPGSWGPGAAMSRGVREEVTRQFQFPWLPWAPRNMCQAAIYHLVQGRL